MTPPLAADTGGLLRALARRPDGRPAWPDYQHALTQASTVIVPEGPLPISGTLLLGSLSRAIDRCEGALCIVAAAVHVTQITMVAAPNP